MAAPLTAPYLPASALMCNICSDDFCSARTSGHIASCHSVRACNLWSCVLTSDMPSADPARPQPSGPASSGSGLPSASMRLPAPGAIRPPQQPGNPIMLRTGPPAPGAAPAGNQWQQPMGGPASATQRFGVLPAGPLPSYGPAPSAPRPMASGFGAAGGAFGARPPTAVPGQPRAGGVGPATGPPRSPAAAPTAYPGGGR